MLETRELLKVSHSCDFSYYYFFLFCLFVCLFFRDRVSLCSPGCPGTHFVDQAGLKLRNPPASASASQVLGLKACATMLGFITSF
ncbi:mCG141959 [Mus musculus]|nr:mCG141959 [Mus musculus]